jgi:predicted transcriptional regulator
MISLANAFELKWKNVSEYNDVKKKATTGSEKQKRSQILREMCDDLLRQISQNKVDASRRIYEFLRLADSLVEVSQSARKTMEDLDELQKSVVLSASASGRSVKFRDTRKGKVYFTLKADQKFDKIEFRLE